MEKQFIKIGKKMFNLANITVIGLNAEHIAIKTVDCPEGNHYNIALNTEEGKAFRDWLIYQSIDVLHTPTTQEPEPEPLRPTILEDTSGIRFEV